MDRATYLNELHARFGVARPTIVALIQRVTGERVVSTNRLIRGDENEVHRVELADDSVVYLRVSFPGTPSRKTHHEAWAMDQARGAGAPVPEVIAIETIPTSDAGRTAMVVRGSPGRQLSEVLSTLSPAPRSAAMAEIGRVMGIAHSVRMPGAGVPDAQGNWTDPATHRRDYIATCLADCEHLPTAGLTPAEVDQVVNVLERSSDIDEADSPVLCHGDISPEHVFVDPDLRMVGLIDWGMWSAGTAMSELAVEALKNTATDFDAIIAGHGGLPSETALNRMICRLAIPRATAQIGWLVTSGQSAEVYRPVAGLRWALAAASMT